MTDMTDQSLLSVSADSTGIKMILENLASELAPTVADAAARGVSNLLYDHFMARNERPGREGWPSSNYWADAAESVSVSAGGDGTADVCAHAPGLLMHLKGGTILPKRGKFLAIPISPDVAGIWPREMMQRQKEVKIIPVRGGKGEGFLLAKQPKDGAPIPLWRLVRKSVLKPDPSVIPTMEAQKEAATVAAQAALDALQPGNP